MKICLNMIVKNEAPRIARMLESVLPHIAAAAIIDTGSNDGTLELAALTLTRPGMRFVLEQRPWVDFSTNRNEALELARGAFDDVDYLLLLDADHELIVQPGALDKLTERAYDLTMNDPVITYSCPRLIRRDLACAYVGVTHEYLNLAWMPPLLPGVRIVDHIDGASRADKFSRDIQLLQDELGRNPDDARSWFYLAQSHRDNGQTLAAFEAYVHRSRMPGWDEETWYAIWQAAKLADKLERDDAPGLYLQAIHARPIRAEAYVDLAAWLRIHGFHEAALTFARQALRLPKPTDRLFVEDSYYAWRALDEVAISAFYTGNLVEGRKAAERLLPVAPAAETARVVANLAYYR